jgi:predicted HNH restriction endonuclease
MKWKKEDENFLIEKYPTSISLLEISNKLNKSKKSIQHKAARLELSRPRIPINKPKNKSHRKIYDKNYYEKNKLDIYNNKKERLKNKKIELIKLLGGKCKLCGYNKCIEALDFHHDKGNKEACISKIIKDYSKQKALKEAEKCIILCANCHRELHNKGA